MVTKGELGRSAERLREQMEKMQLHSSEGKVVMLEQQLTMAEERLRRLEREKQAAETRAEIRAERRVSDTEGWWRMEGQKQIRTDKRALKVARSPVYLKVQKPGIQADKTLCLCKILAKSPFWES